MQSNYRNDSQYTTIAPRSLAAGATSPIGNHQAPVATQTSHREEDDKIYTLATGVISVLLVDDHALMREGLCKLLALEEDVQIVGEAVDGFDAMAKIHQLRPQVVLMDISMPIIDGLALTRQVTQEFLDIAVIMLTMHRQNQQIVQAMKNGARGYLLKSASSKEVARAIRTVREGGTFIEPGMTSAVISEFRRLSTPASSPAAPVRDITALTEKEVEIIRYVARGMNNKEIAQQLAYSEKTVKNYLTTIFQKLNMRDRTQVAIYALRQGLLPDEA